MQVSENKAYIRVNEITNNLKQMQNEINTERADKQLTKIECEMLNTYYLDLSTLSSIFIWFPDLHGLAKSLTHMLENASRRVGIWDKFQGDDETSLDNITMLICIAELLQIVIINYFEAFPEDLSDTSLLDGVLATNNEEE